MNVLHVAEEGGPEGRRFPGSTGSKLAEQTEQLGQRRNNQQELTQMSTLYSCPNSAPFS